MAFFVVRSLDVFRTETNRRLAEMEQAQALAADRERIGRELHDGIIQNIYAAGLSLERLERQLAGEPERVARVRAVLSILNQTIQDIRSYIFDLKAAEQTRELEAVLEELVRDLRLDTLMEVHLHVAGKRCWRMTSQQTAHLTQIAREALSNVVQHAQAQRVTVNLQYRADDVRLSVADDGRGVAPGALGDGPDAGHGIANMRERTRLLDGEFDLKSKPGHGLRLSVSVPCQAGRRRGG
jgi:signal transduction histidine kinase